MPRSRQIFGRFMGETLFGGFGFVATIRTRVERTFWSVVVIACIGGLLFQTIMTAYNYLNELPATSLDMKAGEAMQLPDAVICLPTRLDAEKVRSLSISQELAQFLEYGFHSGIASLAKVTAEQAQEKLKAVPAHMAYTTREAVDYEQLVRRLAITTSDAFAYCLSKAAPF